MRKRFLTMLLGLGLVLSMFVGTLGTASADHTGTQNVYAPWVPNGAELVGIDGEVTGPWYGTVTVQNIESSAIEIDFYVGEPGNGFELRRTEAVDPYASTTVSVAELAEASDGDGFAVKAMGYVQREETELNDEDEEVVTQEEIRAHITGAVKNVSPQPSSDGKTNGNHIEVDGYTTHTENQVGPGNHILPITQTNDGWNTEIKIANWDDGGASQSVTVDFYGAFGEGVAGSSSGTFSLSLDPGEVEKVNLDQLEDQLGLGEDFVGSAWISSSSTATISAVAERVKPIDNMLVSNTSRREGEGNNTKYAPLVFQNYNMWNTGISVANLSDSTNTVRVTFVGPTTSGQVQEVLEIAPRSMEYVHIPGVQELGLDDEGFVGSAVLHSESDLPFHAAVDQIKYFGSGIDVGSAMSYITEHDTAGDSNPEDAVGDGLALPIYSKGNDAGNGDTSGIQLFNASTSDDVNAHITFYDQSGAKVAPTINNPHTVNLSPRESRTVYALQMPTMPDNFFGSAIIQVSGDGELVGVSNSVNYDVQNDGSVAFNVIRVPGDPAERTATRFEYNPISDTNVWGDTHEITVTVYDQFDDPLEGVGVEAEITEGPHVNYSEAGDVMSGTTDSNGEVVISYTGGNPHHGLSQDTIVIQVDGIDGVGYASKTWEFGPPAAITLAHAEEVEGTPRNTIYFDPHTVVATVTDANGNLLKDIDVTFDVDTSDSPERSDLSEVETTDENGEAEYEYTAPRPGADPEYTDNITASVDGGALTSNTIQKVWLNLVLSLDHVDNPDDPANVTYVSSHTVQANLQNTDGENVEGADIDFTVSGANSDSGSGVTDVDGNVQFMYEGTNPGDDDILAELAVDADDYNATVSKTWYELDVQISHAEGHDATNPTGSWHEVEAELGFYTDPLDDTTWVALSDNYPGVDFSGMTVNFDVAGPNQQNTTPQLTNADAVATFGYYGNNTGVDTITATEPQTGNSDDIDKTWEELFISLAMADGESTQNYIFIEDHTVVATVVDQDDNLVDGVDVTFTILGEHEAPFNNGTTDDPGATAWNQGQTGAAGSPGQIAFTYTGHLVGHDNIQATIDANGKFTSSEPKEWMGIGLDLVHADQDDPALNQYGESHTVVATLVDSNGDTIDDIDVDLAIEVVGEDADGEWTYDPGQSGTTTAGEFAMTYEYSGDPNSPGDEETHTLTANLVGTSIMSNDITKTWYEPIGQDIELSIVNTQYDHPDNGSWIAYDLIAHVYDQFGVVMENQDVDLTRNVLQSIGGHPGQFINDDTPPTGEGATWQVNTGGDGQQGTFTYIVNLANPNADLTEDIIVEITGTHATAGSDDVVITFEDVARFVDEIVLESDPPATSPAYTDGHIFGLTATVYDQHGDEMNDVLVTFTMTSGYENDGASNQVGLRQIGAAGQFSPEVDKSTDGGDNGESSVEAVRGQNTAAPRQALVVASAGGVTSNEADLNWIQVASSIQLSPLGPVTNYIGPVADNHDVDAQILDQDGFWYEEGLIDIEFTATDQNGGPAPYSETIQTNGQGQATFSYNRSVEAEDHISATATVDGNVINEDDVAVKIWEELNLVVTPPTGFNLALVEEHTFTAQLVDSIGNQVPMSGVAVNWEFDSLDYETTDVINPVVSDEQVAFDAVAGTAVGETDANGEATFTYTGNQRDLAEMPYTHSMEASLDTGVTGSGSKTWEPLGIEVFHFDTPDTDAFNIDGDEHTIIAQLVDGIGDPVMADGIDVTFFSNFNDLVPAPEGTLAYGAHAPGDGATLDNTTQGGSTDGGGQFALTVSYELGGAETDLTLELGAEIDGTDVDSSVITKTWYEQDPDQIVLTEDGLFSDGDEDYYELTATVTDQHGQPIPGLNVTFDRDGGPGQFFVGGAGTGPQAVHGPTDGDGQISVEYRINRIVQAANYPITINVEASTGGVTSNSVPLLFELNPSVATSVVLTSDPAAASPATTTGEAFELYAEVLDQHGLPMENKLVNFALTSGHSSLAPNLYGLREGGSGTPGGFNQNVTLTTGPGGEAYAQAVRGNAVNNLPHQATVQAIYNDIESNEIDLIWEPQQATTLNISADPNPIVYVPQLVPSFTTVTAEVLDQDGVAIPNIEIEFTTSGTGAPFGVPGGFDTAPFPPLADYDVAPRQLFTNGIGQASVPHVMRPVHLLSIAERQIDVTATIIEAGQPPLTETVTVVFDGDSP